MRTPGSFAATFRISETRDSGFTTFLLRVMRPMLGAVSDDSLGRLSHLPVLRSDLWSFGKLLPCPRSLIQVLMIMMHLRYYGSRCTRLRA